MSWADDNPELAETFIQKGLERKLAMVLDTDALATKNLTYEKLAEEYLNTRGADWRNMCIDLAWKEITQVQQEYMADHSDIHERSDR